MTAAATAGAKVAVTEATVSAKAGAIAVVTTRLWVTADRFRAATQWNHPRNPGLKLANQPKTRDFLARGEI